MLYGLQGTKGMEPRRGSGNLITPGIAGYRLRSLATTASDTWSVLEFELWSEPGYTGTRYSHSPPADYATYTFASSTLNGTSTPDKIKDGSIANNWNDSWRSANAPTGPGEFVGMWFARTALNNQLFPSYAPPLVRSARFYNISNAPLLMPAVALDGLKVSADGNSRWVELGSIDGISTGLTWYGWPSL